jgi:hypothetical protein
VPLFTEVGAKVSNTSVKSGVEPLKSRWDYRSRGESVEYFGKIRGRAIEIKTRSRQDYRSGSKKGEYFGKIRGGAIEIKIGLPKWERKGRILR